MEVGEPAVIDEELIRKAIVPPTTAEGGTLSHEKREELRKEIEFHEVETLMFSFCNILKIDNLVGLDKLVKLQLDNNIIHKIEAVEHLTNLQWLDFSFNNISKIENLNTLTKLKDLSLFNNQISVLENLDTLTNLNVLSIGNNEIKALDNLIYLRRFPELRLVNCAGNPVSKDLEYRPYVIAHVKGLQYLDYRLVEESAVVTAKEQYQDELIDLEERESAERDQKEKAKEAAAKIAKYAEANLEGIDTMHDDMFREDPDMMRLSMLSFWGDIMDEYKENSHELAMEFVKAVLAQHEVKKTEKARFGAAITKSHSNTEKLSIALIRQFEVKKKKTFRDLRFAESHENVVRLKDLKVACGQLGDDLMELELRQTEEEQSLNLDFERRYQDDLTTTIEYINGYFMKLRELENARHDKAMTMANEEMEKFANNMLEDVTEEAAGLLQDKEALVNALNSSHDLHLSKIDAKEDEMINVETRIFTALLADSKNQAEKRNRDRITEINMLCERSSREIEDVLNEEEALERDDSRHGSESPESADLLVFAWPRALVTIPGPGVSLAASRKEPPTTRDTHASESWWITAGVVEWSATDCNQPADCDQPAVVDQATEIDAPRVSNEEARSCLLPEAPIQAALTRLGRHSGRNPCATSVWFPACTNQRRLVPVVYEVLVGRSLLRPTACSLRGQCNLMNYGSLGTRVRVSPLFNTNRT
eukprot:CAMPEP_0114559746 /NCGR_PEP_ID=MMETSP0114-20121206/11084_1 /TAXON_ID=31324 /ORGANISM="Goniomonas sp, Strain m" /LENGTH=706 /DNA_ID=CAMNT_0001745233 /DNA_START=21 /DNA_END=2137 /DNA_ORIENTATION=+